MHATCCLQLREQEKKRVYAAELQAQMQEKERQRQLDRMHRLGVPSQGAAHGAASRTHTQNCSATSPAAGTVYDR